MEIPSRGQFEATLAARLSRVASGRRRELLGLLGDPPDPSSVGESIWLEYQRQTEEELAILLFLIFLASANFHATGREPGASQRQPGRSGDSEQLEAQARLFSQRRAAQVSSSMAQTARERFSTLASDIRSSEQPLTRGELASRAASIFGPEQAEAVAVTETTTAQSLGAEAGIEQVGGASDSDLWITERDQRVCPICRPLHERSRRVWGAQFPDGPPAHPRCRCYVVYLNRPQQSRESRLRRRRMMLRRP